MGSAFELETQLIISKELAYLTEKEFASLAERINKIQRGMNVFRKMVLSNDK